MTDFNETVPNRLIEAPRGEDFEFVLGFVLGVLTGILMTAVLWKVFG